MHKSPDVISLKRFPLTGASEVIFSLLVEVKERKERRFSLSLSPATLFADAKKISNRSNAASYRRMRTLQLLEIF